MTGVCSLCGHVGPVHAHHLTGRMERDGCYLDSALVLPLCPGCHGAAGGVHPILRACSLDFPRPGADLLSHRLRRVGLHAVLLADTGRPLALDPSSSRSLAALMFEAADAFRIDERGAA